MSIQTREINFRPANASPRRQLSAPASATFVMVRAHLSTLSHSRCAISQIAVRKIVAHKHVRVLTSGSGAMIEYGHFIGGKQVAGKSGRTADVFQPMDGTVGAHVALASKAGMGAAVENAKTAQLGWAAVNPQRRARVLMKFL